MPEDRKYQVLIGGEWVDGADGSYDVVNPATEEIVGVAPEASAAQAHDAARAAQEAFPTWSQTTPEERAELLEKAAVAMRAHAGSAPHRDRRNRLHRGRRQADAGAAPCGRASRRTRAAGPRPDRDPVAAAGDAGHRARARRAHRRDGRGASPVGAVACITPYNFPIVNMAGKLGPALAMGNTVVVRPASQNPLAVIDLVKILHDVGFPPGVINVVTGSTPADG